MAGRFGPQGELPGRAYPPMIQLGARVAGACIGCKPQGGPLQTGEPARDCPHSPACLLRVSQPRSGGWITARPLGASSKSL